MTTTGIRIGGRDSGCYVAASVIAGGDDETQIGFGYSVDRNPARLDLDKAASMAVERSTRLLGASKPPTGRMTIVLDPMVTAQFVGIIGATLSGEALLKGRSLFADRVGEQVASPLITLVDDPTNPSAFTAGEADGEGLATRRNLLIDGGVLSMFVHNSYTGRRSGAASTGNAIRGYSSTPGAGTIALALTPGEREQAEIIADIDDGVLIQGVSGLHSGVNPVSGDFSTGADGLRIRNGELAEPLREFTIGSTLPAHAARRGRGRRRPRLAPQQRCRTLPRRRRTSPCRAPRRDRPLPHRNGPAGAGAAVATSAIAGSGTATVRVSSSRSSTTTASTTPAAGQRRNVGRPEIDEVVTLDQCGGAVDRHRHRDRAGRTQPHRPRRPAGGRARSHRAPGRQRRGRRLAARSPRRPAPSPRAVRRSRWHPRPADRPPTGFHHDRHHRRRTPGFPLGLDRCEPPLHGHREQPDRRDHHAQPKTLDGEAPSEPATAPRPHAPVGPRRP